MIRQKSCLRRPFHACCSHLSLSTVLDRWDEDPCWPTLVLSLCFWEHRCTVNPRWSASARPSDPLEEQTVTGSAIIPMKRFQARECSCQNSTQQEAGGFRRGFQVLESSRWQTRALWLYQAWHNTPLTKDTGYGPVKQQENWRNDKNTAHTHRLLRS